jgi:hypothetical protein
MKANNVVGDRMDDGTICGGISPDTNKMMYVVVADEPLTLTFNEAVTRARELSQERGTFYKVPSAAELEVLYKNRAAIGGFGEESDGAAKGSGSCGHWSSTILKRSAADKSPDDPWRDDTYARIQQREDGAQYYENTMHGLKRAVRFVRS